MSSSALVQKLWNYCHILRDDGLSYGDYASTRLSTGSEQLTFLLFLKMADEQSKPPFNKPSPIPKDFDWESLLRRRKGVGSLLRLIMLISAEPREMIQGVYSRS